MQLTRRLIEASYCVMAARGNLSDAERGHSSTCRLSAISTGTFALTNLPPNRLVLYRGVNPIPFDRRNTPPLAAMKPWSCVIGGSAKQVKA